MDKKNTPLLYIISLAAFLLLFSCAQPVTDTDGKTTDDSSTTPVLVQKEGSANTFDIMTWNIEWFPKEGSTTTNYVKTIIRNLDVDLIAVEEISNTSAFYTLLDSLDGWSGALNNYPSQYSGYQRTGILYKNSMISVTNPHYILEEHLYDFASRPPLTARVAVKDKNNHTVFDFNIIVVHLKAELGNPQDAVRRKNAIIYLEEYIRAEITSGADADFIVLGDWNDKITDPTSSNVFTAFLDHPEDYSFLTSDINGQYSYISNTYKSLIDHIMITKDAQEEFGQGTTQVLYLDNQFSRYQSEVSDHRPVLSIFKGLMLGN